MSMQTATSAYLMDRVSNSHPSYAEPSSPRLVSAAHEFEASMMRELLTPMTSGHSGLGDADDDNGSSSALTSFAGEALGKAISEHGGFGIATSILHQLSSRGNHSGNPVVPVGKNGTTPNSPLK
jgi:Rod binding domain-containing protein